ncbi:DNA-binding GntR family transcriptional regulator [Agromyces terreus]|uniref:DNA-binding GntR family transcriptional regulator n=1 Tax=Agromyces terreus TaxID=424795 RepID=A0A9X2H077_9MICO|nr:GntR family transcriptional regulator [Agromyces terreus]MCP2370543.1 DNA-binding GntR family transcriptional regulator [Agromyces terreus]
MSAQNAAPSVGDGGAAALQQLAGRHATGYRSVGVMVYDILKDAILSGALLPGQKLRQETLAELIGVSRLPVRSALIQLEADGLVEFHERRGAVVKSLSPAQAAEVYDIRLLLEVEALRLTMAELTDERVARLRELGKAADRQQEGADFVDARTEFYSELYDAANRPVLWEMIEQLRLKVGRYVLGWRLVGDAEHSHTHEQLIEAVASRDVERAVGVLRDHLVGVREAVLELLEAEAADAGGPAPRVRSPR